MSTLLALEKKLMGYDFDGWNAGFTEDEIASGVPSLIEGGWRDEEYRARNEEVEIMRRERRNIAMKVVAGLEDYIEIKNKFIKLILSDEINYAIERYVYRESLPKIYIDLVKSNQCMEVLIKTVFKEIGGISITLSLNREILELSGKLHKNETLKTVYYRVKEVQQFLHKKINSAYGADMYHNTPKMLMKNTLSACRLHLNITDIRRHDYNYLVNIIEESTRESEYEAIFQPKVELPEGKIFRPDWKVTHLQPLSFYCLAFTRENIRGIKLLDTEIPIEKFKEEIITLYAES